MLELKDWIEQTKFLDKPWLVLGKGPTFARRYEIDLEQYNTIALNHVVREQCVDVAHIIDIDVVEACGDALVHNSTWLLMPRHPHVNCIASDYLELSDWVKLIPALAEVESRGKLIQYSFSHEPTSEDHWTIGARYFSSEAALGILGRMGIKTVRSLGIDGGRNYSGAFADLNNQTLLLNGQRDFDLQFNQLHEIAQHFKIDFQPLLSNSQDDQLPSSDLSGNGSQHTLEDGQQPETTAKKLQHLECDLRQSNADLKESEDLLLEVVKELSVCCERLDWSQNEIKEYRERVLALEKELHLLLRSNTWKLGRVLTKPVEAISKRFSRDSS